MNDMIYSAQAEAMRLRSVQQTTLEREAAEKHAADQLASYQEIEPLLTWLDDADEDEIVAQMGGLPLNADMTEEQFDGLLVAQGLRGLLDDEQRKAMFAKMGGRGGGEKGVGKGMVGKAVGAGKKAEHGLGKTGSKPGTVGKGVGKGVGKAVAPAKMGRVASFKQGTAKKLYNARVAHHVNQAPRDLTMAKHHLAQAGVHKAKAAEFQQAADYHHAEASTVGNLLGSLAHAAINPGVKDTQGSVGHREMAREASAMAEHHLNLSIGHSSEAKHHANQARMHAKLATSMKRNNPYR